MLTAVCREVVPADAVGEPGSFGVGSFGVVASAVDDEREAVLGTCGDR
jgi:hypothetical protein